MTTENTTTTTEITPSEKSQTAMDKALAKARARALAKGKPAPESLDETTKVTPTEKTAKTSKGKKEKVVKETVKKAKPDPKVIEAEKAAKKVEREASRAVRAEKIATAKAARDEVRATKKAAREAAVKPAHLSKVDKALAKLPVMDAATQTVYDLVATAGLNDAQSTILTSHLAHLNRLNATLRSRKGVKLTEGQRVTIVSCDRDARLIGLEGTITQVRKIRVLVDVGQKRPAYLFLSDVAVMEDGQEVPAEETSIESPASSEVQFLSPEEDAPAATGTENA